MLKKTLGTVLLVLAICGTSFAMHPLITDDTGTQGKGKFQIELNYEFDHEDTGGVEENLHQVQSSLSCHTGSSIRWISLSAYPISLSPQERAE